MLNFSTIAIMVTEVTTPLKASDELSSAAPLTQYSGAVFFYIAFGALLTHNHAR